MVVASRGKQVRAEPVASWYEQHRVHHVGQYPVLEDQMTSWDPSAAGPSPENRLVQEQNTFCLTIGWADSSSGANTPGRFHVLAGQSGQQYSEVLSRCREVQRLARSVVQAVRDGVEVGLAERRQGRPLGEILA